VEVEDFQCLDGHSVPGLISRYPGSRYVEFQCLDGHSVPGQTMKRLILALFTILGFNALTVIQSRDVLVTDHVQPPDSAFQCLDGHSVPGRMTNIIVDGKPVPEVSMP